MVAYPTSLPLTAIQSCMSIIQNREIAEKKAEFGYNAWNVQGYLQSVLLGMPAQPALPGEEKPSKKTKASKPKETISEDDIELMTQFKAELEECHAIASGPQFGSQLATASDEERGNWQIVVSMVLPILIDLVTKWLENRKK